jgi:hypothetical protein
VSAVALIEREPSVRTVTIEDEVVLTKFAECKCFALNRAASIVWGAIETPNTIEWICGKLSERYAVSAEDCQREVEALVEKWTRLRLVRAVD